MAVIRMKVKHENGSKKLLPFTTIIANISNARSLAAARYMTTVTILYMSELTLNLKPKIRLSTLVG